MAYLLLIFYLLVTPSQSENFIKSFDQVTLSNGLVLDRSSDRNTVSCAATGMTAYSRAILIEKNLIPTEPARTQIYSGFRNTIASTPKENQGWLYHFTDCQGNPKSYSEISTIDSALFYLGFLRAAQTLKDAQFEKEVQDAINSVNLPMAMNGNYFHHGFKKTTSSLTPINELWDDYNEGVLLYRLFNLNFTEVKNEPSLPLFVYYYPLCFFDEPQYRERLNLAIQYQVSTFGYAGITACDGPEGYQVGDPTVISPLSLWACSRFSDLASLELKRQNKPPNLFSYSLIHTNWQSSDIVSIDLASCFLCLH